MPYKARLKTSDTTEHAISVMDALQLDPPQEYYFCECDKCNCKYKLRSENSNIVAPHFYRPDGQRHSVNCWFPFVESIKSNSCKINFNSFHADTFLATMETAECREGKPTISHKRAGSMVQRINPVTLRQLYRICCLSDEKTVIGQCGDAPITVKELFVARKTEYFYRYFCEGIKLVEAKYRSYSKDNSTITFKFPFSTDDQNDSNFEIHAQFPQKAVFYNTRNYLYGNKNPVLIYANFTRNTSCKRIIDCKIINIHQIVALPNPKR